VTWLPLLGFGSFVLVSSVAGGRLLLLARRTRQPAEAALGAALFLGGGIGWALLVFGLQILPRESAPATLLAANLFIHAGAVALAAGTAHMFRPAEPLARAAVTALAALFVVSLARRVREATVLPVPPTVFWTSTIGGALCYGWTAVESLRWYARLRRRMRFELADADATRRMGLWAAACSIAVGIHVVTAANRFVVADGLHPAALALSSLLGLGAATCLWQAFFPRRPRQPAAVTDGAA
jgi:hypothetical protein